MLINKAIIMATQAHEKQSRKGTNIPYILHPLEAGTISQSILSDLIKDDKDIVSASILHDTIEDTELTEDFLRVHFTDRIVDLVVSQSEDKSKSWQERKEHTIQLLNKTNDLDIKIVHLADKLSNMRAIARDYNILGNELWDRFNKGESHQKWYYTSLCNEMNELKDTNAYKEFKFLINKVFE